MASAVPDDLIDVPDDLVDVPAAAGGLRPPPAQPGVPRAIGVSAPPPSAPPPQRNLLDTVRGLREAAIEVVSMATGGTVGALGGFAGGLAAALGGARFRGEEGQNVGLMAHRALEQGVAESAQRGTGVVRDFLRGSDGRGQPVSPAGQEYIEGVTHVMQNAPALVAAPRGTVGMSPQQPLGLKPALQAMGDATRAAGSRAVDAAVPQLSPRSVARVQMASDAGIPIAPHQLATSSVAKAAGKAATEVPFSGGASLRKAQREGVSGGLVKAIDPESTAPLLDDATFAKLQDAAGERIGEIAARTDIPVETFGDLTTITRRDTPDVQGVISTYATDLAKIAGDNGGVVPGTVLRKLRTEAQQQARGARANKGDLARALDDFVKRLDEAVTERAPEADVAALLEARRQYAVSKALEPLVAKYSDGNIPPQALKAALTGTKEGKRRMARGKAGELGEYANLGSEILSEQSLSAIPERNLVYRALGDVAAAGKLAVVYPFALAYNKLGPRAVKWLADRQARAAAPVPDAPAPGLELAPEGPLPARPGPEAPATPLGDLTPDWETAPGAAPARPAMEMVPAEGLVQAVDSPQGPARVRTVDEPAPPAKGAGSEIPAVPGRPDLPESMVAGPPAELAPTEAVGVAMQEPTTALARQQQEAARLAAASQSPEVQRVLAEHARALERRAAAEAAKQKRLQDAAELRRVASETADPEIQRALHARAATLEAAEPVPTGKAKELESAPAKPAPKAPEKPLPTGEVTEVAAEAGGPAKGPTRDVDSVWRQLQGKEEGGRGPKATGEIDDFVISEQKGDQWVALNVREFRQDSGAVVYSASLEVGSKGYPTGTGVATQMYVDALRVAQKRGMGWQSEGVRSDQAYAIYERLKKAGVPFKEEGGAAVISAETLAGVDLAAVAEKTVPQRGQPVIEASRTEPRVGKAGPKDKFIVGRVYRDSQGNMAIRQADGSWKEIK